MNNKDNTFVLSYRVRLQSEGSPERVFDLAPGSMFTVPIKEKKNCVLEKIKDQYGDIYTPGQNIAINYDLILTYQWKSEETPAIYFETQPTYTGLEITCYNGKFSKVVIPEIIEGKKVTAIDSDAFNRCTGLISVRIPDGITSIGVKAFFGCTHLVSVTIPDGVTSIGLGAFAICSGLKSISVDTSNPQYYSEGNCIIQKEDKTLIAGCKNSVIPDNVTSIGIVAFLGCFYLKKIKIPNSVTTIGEGAFAGCHSLTSIEIPASVTSIGNKVFDDWASGQTINICKSKDKVDSQWSSNWKEGCKAHIVYDYKPSP